MASNEIPTIEFSEEQLAAIRQELEITEMPPEGIEDVVIPPVKKRRGRPPKIRLAEEDRATTPTPIIPPAKLGKRDEREVSERLANILMGGTGLTAQVKPYLQMTEDEAKAIADPLSSYLVRNAETIGIAQQILENYDLLAIVLGVLAYTVRVYRERSDELAQQRVTNTKPTALDRVAKLTEAANNGQEQRGANIVSTPYDTGYGTGS